MVKIEICVGSSCHIKGAQQVVRAFEEQIDRYLPDIKPEVQLVGSFCHGNCTQGVNIKINNQAFHNVTPEQVPVIFERWVLGEV
jgi:NADH:ubiquinone oxidoreductase subunit E